MTACLLAAVLCCPWAAQLDIGAVRSEPDLEKRSDRALDHAHKTLDRAQRAYRDNDVDGAETALAAIREAVDLSVDSLRATGKNPRRSPKYFKRAEIQMRKLARRLEEFRTAMAVDDRVLVEPLVAHARTVHEALLTGIMSKNK